MAETLTIPAPIVKPGDQAMVQNYRRKPWQWERCEVDYVEWVWGGYIEPKWRYYVSLTRTSPSGRYIALKVGADQIRALSSRGEGA